MKCRFRISPQGYRKYWQCNLGADDRKCNFWKNWEDLRIPKPQVMGSAGEEHNTRLQELPHFLDLPERTTRCAQTLTQGKLAVEN